MATGILNDYSMFPFGRLGCVLLFKVSGSRVFLRLSCLGGVSSLFLSACASFHAPRSFDNFEAHGEARGRFVQLVCSLSLNGFPGLRTSSVWLEGLGLRV